MKRFILFLLAFGMILFSQQFEILKDVIELSGDLTAQKFGYKDVNGQWCAILKVHTNVKDMSFYSMGYEKHDYQSESGIYLVYLQPDTRNLRFLKQGFIALNHSFPFRLKSNTVYQIDIKGIEEEKKLEDITINIIGEPANSSITLDGVEKGLITSVKVSVGKHELKVFKEGYKAYTKIIEVSPDLTMFRYELEEVEDALVEINSNPPGAVVYIDDVKFGETPISGFYPAGTYKIKLTSDNYEDIEENIVIKGQETKKSYQLTDIRATLTINTHEKAKVYLNGQLVTNYKNIKLPPQLVNIKVEMNKAKTLEERIILKKKENKTIDMHPEIDTGKIQIAVMPSDAEIELWEEGGEKYLSIGSKSFSNVPIGSYKIKASKKGYKTIYDTITLTAEAIAKKSIQLEESVADEYINSDFDTKDKNVENFSIAYVNSDKVLANFNVAKKAKEELAKWNKEMEGKAVAMESEIKALEDEIKNMSVMVSEEKRNEKMAEGQKKLQDYYQYKDKVWGTNGEFNDKNTELMQPVLEKINSSIKQVSESAQFDMVLDANTGTVLYASSDFEITNNILNNLEEGKLDLVSRDRNKTNNYLSMPISFGYINSEKVLADFNDAKKAKEELAKWNKEMEGKAAKMESEIKELEDEIKNMSVMVSEEIRNEKMVEGQKKLQEYYDFKENIWGETGEFNKKNTELMQPIIDKINDNIKSFSTASGFNIVLDANTGTLLYAKPEFEITESILSNLRSQSVSKKEISKKRLKYGYVNSDKVLLEYGKAKDAKAKLAKWNKEMEDEAAGMEKEVKTLEDEIKNMSTMVSEEKRNEKMAEGQKKLQEYYQYKEKVWGQQGDFYKKNSELMQPVIDRINVAIKKFGDKENYDILLDGNTGTLLYATPESDVTDKILKELR